VRSQDWEQLGLELLGRFFVRTMTDVIQQVPVDQGRIE